MEGGILITVAALVCAPVIVIGGFILVIVGIVRNSGRGSRGAGGHVGSHGHAGQYGAGDGGFGDGGGGGGGGGGGDGGGGC